MIQVPDAIRGALDEAGRVFVPKVFPTLNEDVPRDGAANHPSAAVIAWATILRDRPGELHDMVTQVTPSSAKEYDETLQAYAPAVQRLGRGRASIDEVVRVAALFEAVRRTSDEFRAGDAGQVHGSYGGLANLAYRSRFLEVGHAYADWSLSDLHPTEFVNRYANQTTQNDCWWVQTACPGDLRDLAPPLKTLVDRGARVVIIGDRKASEDDAWENAGFVRAAGGRYLDGVRYCVDREDGLTIGVA